MYMLWLVLLRRVRRVHSQFVVWIIQNKRGLCYFQGKAQPKLMLAMEYEDNLDNYAHANYEIQILLEKN